MSEADHIVLTSVYNGDDDKIYSLLYQLLGEREIDEAISHQGMPTFKQHIDFINRRPYKFWGMIIQGEGNVVGSIYLSHSNEIGIAIFKKHRRKGYAKAAIKTLLRTFANEKFFIANINPLNVKSIDLFKGLGFGIIQETYKLNREGPQNAVS